MVDVRQREYAIGLRGTASSVLVTKNTWTSVRASLESTSKTEPSSCAIWIRRSAFRILLEWSGTSGPMED